MGKKPPPPKPAKKAAPPPAKKAACRFCQGTGKTVTEHLEEGMGDGPPFFRQERTSSIGDCSKCGGTG